MERAGAGDIAFRPRQAFGHGNPPLRSALEPSPDRNVPARWRDASLHPRGTLETPAQPLTGAFKTYMNQAHSLAADAAAVATLPAAEPGTLHALVLQSLDDDQAQDLVSIPLEGKSSIADHMVIASGRSTRQVA